MRSSPIRSPVSAAKNARTSSPRTKHSRLAKSITGSRPSSGHRRSAGDETDPHPDQGTKPLDYGGGNTLAIYTFLADVEYQVRAHSSGMTPARAADDRIDGKHFAIARRMLELGGRQDILSRHARLPGLRRALQIRRGNRHYDDLDRMDYGLTFHGFDYPARPGIHPRGALLATRHGIGRVRFPRPKPATSQDHTPHDRKRFGKGQLRSVEPKSPSWGLR